MSDHQHHDRHSHAAVAATPPATGDLATLELEITSYFMGSGCPYIEEHVSDVGGVQGVIVNRTTGIIQVSYYPDQTGPDETIEAVKHCGFICREGGPIYRASRPGATHAEHLAYATNAEEVVHEEHDAHVGHGAHTATTMRNLFLVATVLTIIEIIYPPLGTRLLGLSPAKLFGIRNEFFQFLLTKPVVFWGAGPFCQ